MFPQRRFSARHPAKGVVAGRLGMAWTAVREGSVAPSARPRARNTMPQHRDYGALMRPVFCFLLLVLAPLTLSAQTSQFDLLIRNGHIIDGTGSPWYAGDVGIHDGHIAAIGRFADPSAKDTIDAAGLVVAPGFIDMLGQSDLSILVDPRVPSKIFQGITTEITGEGSSAGPLNDAIIASDKASYEPLHL